jgi:signal peptidase II
LTPNRSLGLTLAAFAFALDQLIKWIVIVPLSLRGGQMELIPIFNLTWVENWGVSLGIFNTGKCSSFGMTPDVAAECYRASYALVALTGLIATVVAVWMWREKNRQDVFGLGLIFGGALGNILDRVRFGHVVDYADLHFGAFRPFLVFNIADAAITIGVLILFFRALFARDKPKVEADA